MTKTEIRLEELRRYHKQFEANTNHQRESLGSFVDTRLAALSLLIEITIEQLEAKYIEECDYDSYEGINLETSVNEDD